MRPISFFATLAVSLVFIACNSQPPQAGATGAVDVKPAAGPVRGGAADGVAWLDGSFDDALARARAEGKPLLLFWAAAWCPHCHHLEHQIFARAEFIAASRDFVAFRLDADAAGAQLLGEKLDTRGYPTVILFDAGGRELMRVSSDTPLDAYTRVLETVRARQRPIEEVLAAVRGAGPGRADLGDLNLFASYAWDQDNRLQLLPQEAPETFKNLYEATPPEHAVEKSRFLLLWLGSVALGDARAKATVPSLSLPERNAATAAVLAVLGDPAQRRANLGALFGATDPIVRLLTPEPGAERAALVAAWEQAARALEDDVALSIDNRLSAVFPRLDLARLEGGQRAPLSASLVEHVCERVAWAAASVTAAGEFQTVLNTMASALEQAGLGAEIEALLESKMGQAQAPYYYMSWLSNLRAQAGDKAGAIAWARRAYDVAQGRYTRFRWGTSYLRQLTQLAPDDVPAIEAGSREVLGELLQLDDAFAGSNLARLEQLARTYDEWASEAPRAAVVANLRELVHAQCPRFSAAQEPAQRERCLAFLANA